VNISLYVTKFFTLHYTNFFYLLFLLFSSIPLLTPWRYSSCSTLATSHILCDVSWQQMFTVWGRQPHAQPPTCMTRVSLLVWHLPRNPSGMGGLTSSYIALLEFIGAYKPPHPATKCFRQGRDTIERSSIPIRTLFSKLSNYNPSLGWGAMIHVHIKCEVISGNIR
jgi:hypothetical protein